MCAIEEAVIQKDTAKLKTVCKTLKQEDIKEKEIENIISKTIEWIEQAQEEFTEIFYTMSRKCERILQKNHKIIKTIFDKIKITKNFTAKWEMQLIKHKAKVAEPFMLKMIEEKVNKGSTKEKQEWEVFQEVYT